MTRRGVVLVGVVLLLAGPAHASAAHWSFEVLEVAELDPGSHRIRLRPNPRGRRFPQSCETLVVRSEFDLGEWSAAAREAVPREGHDRSLTLLRQAQATGGIARFGRIGRGFAAAADAPPCEVSSRGLVVLVDPAGFSVIFSLYEEPTDAFFDASDP